MKKIAINSLTITCVLFISLTHTISKHYPSFLIFYVSIVSLVYVTIFIVLFFKQKNMKELNDYRWTYWIGIIAMVFYFFSEL